MREWNEILPFREFIVKRNDADLAEFLKRAKALKTFREGAVMPLGICTTALDKIAKQCSVCQPCFSGISRQASRSLVFVGVSSSGKRCWRLAVIVMLLAWLSLWMLYRFM